MWSTFQDLLMWEFLPQGELQDCYTRASRRPLLETQDGNTMYTVHSQRLKEAKDAFRNITVIAYGM